MMRAYICFVAFLRRFRIYWGYVWGIPLPCIPEQGSITHFRKRGLELTNYRQTLLKHRRADPCLENVSRGQLGYYAKAKLVNIDFDN